MPRIAVNPEQLRQLSAQLRQSSNQLRDINGRAQIATTGLDFEVHQKANIEGEISQLSSQAGILVEQIEAMARYLERKARVFEETDRPDISLDWAGLLDALAKFRPSLPIKVFGLSDISRDSSEDVAGTGSMFLAGSGSILPLTTLRSVVVASVLLATANLRGGESIKAGQKVPENFSDNAANNVPIFFDDRLQTGQYYPRGKYGNCTWYVAEAVKHASEGRIDISRSPFPNWGNAKNWLNNAKEYMENNPGGIVAGIDHQPRAGDIAFVPPGHVAFVESVEKLPDGNLIVVFSDENYSGKVVEWAGEQGQARQITAEGSEIRRWQHQTIVPGFKNTQFIHLNY